MFGSEETSPAQIDWQEIQQMNGRLKKMRAKSQATVQPVYETYMTDKHRENTKIGGLIPTLKNNDDRVGVNRWTGDQVIPFEAQLRNSVYRDSSGHVDDSDWQLKVRREYGAAANDALYHPEFNPAEQAALEENFGGHAPQPTMDFEAATGFGGDATLSLPMYSTTHAFFDSLAPAPAEEEAPAQPELEPQSEPIQRYSYATETKVEHSEATAPAALADTTGSADFSPPSQHESSSLYDQHAVAAYYDEYSPEEMDLLQSIRSQIGSEAPAETETAWFGVEEQEITGDYPAAPAPEEVQPAAKPITSGLPRRTTA
jgi:hypothetical protein